MEFEVSFAFTQKDFQELMRVTRRQRQGPVRTVFLLIAAAFGAMFLIGLVRMLRQILVEGAQGLAVYRPILIIAAFWVLWSVIASDRVLAMWGWKQYTNKGEVHHYRFCEDGCFYCSNVNEQRIDWSLFQELVETPYAYLLFMASGAAHIIRKSAFTQGDPEGFRDFISRAAGKPVRYVK